MVLSLEEEEMLNNSCVQCDQGFKMGQDMLTYMGSYYHPHCFVCEQCFRSVYFQVGSKNDKNFRPFDDDEIYEFESKKYCEQDYKLLYAPQCAACGDFVFGEVIKV